MHIERAYCVELGRVTDIYEARDHFFSQTPPRRRFRFLCSDEACREANSTKVTGVNYDKLVEESDQYVKPHFRENTEHIPECEWVELEIAIIELEEEGGDDPGAVGVARQSRRGRNAKSSDVIDIFAPESGGADPVCVVGARPVAVFSGGSRDIIKGASYKRIRIEALKKYLRDNPNRTGFLENVVDSYLALEPDERKSASLKIGRSRRRSYRECFRPIRFYAPGRDEDFIYYGGVRAKSYGPNYSLTFFDKAVFEGSERLVSLYIKKEKLDVYRHRAYLREFLERLVDGSARYATCYFYGHIQPGAKNNAFLDVELDHFDNLVLRLK